MSYLDLKDGSRELGRAQLPDTLTGAGGVTFRLQRAVRKGGNGVVFEALRLTASGGVDRRCAIKMLRRQDTARVDRFQNEARVLKEAGSHPRIAPYYADGDVRLPVGQTSYKVPWIAMELGGTNLRDEIKSNGPVAPDVAVKVAIQTCEALASLHASGFIHRDVKPANLVWEQEANGDVLMIDFGIAKRAEEDVSARPREIFTRQGEFVGPVHFSSPELIKYSEDQHYPVDHRSDIFQVGKVLWFIATGHISAGVPSKRDCPLNGRLRAAVLELIADAADDRPSDATQAIELLRPLQSGGGE